MLELKIFSPQESGFVPEIKWNNEELKVAIAEKMKEYNGLVFTEETISEGKKDRAMGKYSTWANCLYRYDRNGFWILSESN